MHFGPSRRVGAIADDGEQVPRGAERLMYSITINRISSFRPGHKTTRSTTTSTIRKVDQVTEAVGTTTGTREFFTDREIYHSYRRSICCIHPAHTKDMGRRIYDSEVSPSASSAGSSAASSSSSSVLAAGFFALVALGSLGLAAALGTFS